MKPIKTVGLVVVAASVMAFIGASPASANSETIVLCKVAELECENPFPDPTAVVGHATNPKLLSSLGTVECEKSLAELTLLIKTNIALISHVLFASMEGNCHLGSTSCSVTFTELGSNTLTKTGALTAKVESDGKTKATVKCGSFVNCTFGGKPTLTAQSSESGVTTLTAKEATLTEGKGFLCPTTAKWDATYTALGTMYIESP